MSDSIKCLSCGEEKSRDKFNVNNLRKNKIECLKCQNIRRSKAAVEHAKAARASMKERLIMQEIERKAKIKSIVESQLTSKTPYKFTKQTPELKARRDELMYNKEAEEIKSEYEL